MISLEIWASGKGSNAENIVRYFDTKPDVQVTCLTSNNPNSGIFELGKNQQIATDLLPKLNWQASILENLKDRNPDYIVLAGFLKLVPSEIIHKYEGRILNVHPSLLPKYGGKGMYGDRVHRAVLSANEKQTGITIHEVNEEFDKGKMVAQFTTDLAKTDSLERVKKKISVLEGQYFPTTIYHWIQANSRS